MTTRDAVASDSPVLAATLLIRSCGYVSSMGAPYLVVLAVLVVLVVEASLRRPGVTCWILPDLGQENASLAHLFRELTRKTRYPTASVRSCTARWHPCVPPAARWGLGPAPSAWLPGILGQIDDRVPLAVAITTKGTRWFVICQIGRRVALNRCLLAVLSALRRDAPRAGDAVLSRGARDTFGELTRHGAADGRWSLPWSPFWLEFFM